MSTNSPSLRRGLVLALCVLAVVAVITWFARDSARPAEGAPPTSVPTAARVADELAIVDAPVTARDAIDAEPVAQAVVATVATPAKHRLSGVVRPAPDRTELLGSVGDVSVRATDALGESAFDSCDANGVYAFEGLMPGRYWLQVRNPDNGNADAVVDVFGDTHLDIQLAAPREIEIRVVDEFGQPTHVLGLLAVATAEPPGDWILEVRGGFGNPLGLSRFDRVLELPSESRSAAIGRLFLDRDPPLHVSLLRYQRVLETRRIELGTKDLEFVLRSDEARVRDGGLRLRVIDAQTSAPIERVSIVADGPGSRWGQTRDGVCEFTGLLPGTYRLRLMSKAHAANQREVRVLPGEMIDVGDVPMTAGHSISGRVLDETGSGSSFSIRYDPCEPDGRIAPVYTGVYGVAVKSDGSFAVLGLAPGFHRLEVLDRDGEKFAECVAVFDVRAGPIENATLTVTAGVPLVVDPNGKHGPDARFAVLDEKGVRVVTTVVDDAAPMRVLLAPGRYTVEFKSSREDPDPRTAPIEIVREPVVVQMR